MSTTETTTGIDGNGAVLFAVVGLTGGTPAEAVLVFPTAASADSWAKREGFDGYTVVPARFVATKVPAPT